MGKFDPRVDAYVAKSADFAKPILEYIRQVVHDASPLITETIKWGFPFFDCNGPVCQMAAFKQHLGFGFWRYKLLNDPHGVIKEQDGTAGSFGKITSIDDLPSKEILTDFILQAIALNETPKIAPVKKIIVPKATLPVPGYFIDFLASHPKAKEAFDNFSPSHRREYLEWILDAKTDVTRVKRMELAAEMMSEGKSRNWKYKTP
jgi:uncharacterized protein YdeI (YjbR/CyaY-like superfamily)